MSAVETIEKVLNTELVLAHGMKFPDAGATVQEIEDEEKLLPRPLSSQHRKLVERWNGLDIGWVIFNCCGNNEISSFRTIASGTQRLSELHLKVEAPIAIGYDSGGFIYLEAKNGEIYEIDFDPYRVNKVANDLDAFVERIFGKDAAKVGGKEWLQELRAAGLHGEAAQKKELSKKVVKLVAYVNEKGWTKCPKCEYSFCVSSETSFKNGKHLRCKQALELVEATSATGQL